MNDPVQDPAGRSFEDAPGWWLAAWRARRPWLALGLSQALFLVLLAPLVYYETFSVFRFYDDEGFLMMGVKHILDGHRLYDEVSTLYGPVYFFYKWLIHGLVGVPLTHDTVRLTASATRLAIGLAASLAAYGLTSSVPLAATAQVLVTTYLTAIASEPGHPQELASLLSMVVVALPASLRTARPHALAMALGAAVALLTMIKINLGVFTGMAVWMALLCAVPGNKPVVALRIVSGAVVVAFPWLFMRPHLATPWTFNFAASEVASLLALAVLALTRSDGRLRIGDLWRYAGAFGVGLALIVLATMLAGTTLHALVESVLFTPLRLPGVLFFALYVWQPKIAAIAVVLAVGARCAGRRLPESLVAWAKLAFGIFTCVATWRHDASALASVAMPFLWLTVLPPVGGAPSVPKSFARLVLCWMAVLSPLQAYPIAGSQVTFGTMLPVLCGVVCLGDAIGWLGSYLVALSGALVRRVTEALLLLVLAVACVSRAVPLEREYRDHEPLGLPGTERIRLTAAEVRAYRELASFVHEHADTVLSVPGFNSLYFWSGTVPPTLDVIGHQMSLFSPERQAAMVNALLAARRPLLVRVPSLSTEISERLYDGFEPVAQFDFFRVLAPRTRSTTMSSRELESDSSVR